MAYKIEYLSVGEVRMGSPFNSVSKYKISGEDYVPELKNLGLQDLHALNQDGKILYQVAWKHISGEPGFIIIRINAVEKITSFSSRISGCCEKIYFEDGKLFVDIFLYEKGKKPEDCVHKGILVDKFPITLKS